MSAVYDDGRVVLRHGHVLDELRAMPAESIQVVCTSPPFWGLRDYQLEPQVWGGLPSGCAHAWGEDLRRHVGGPTGVTSQMIGRAANAVRDTVADRSVGAFCPCGAWRGALGLEPTPELYTAHLVEVFREVRRVLREDGVLFLNLGDCYQSGSRGAYGLDEHRWEKSELQSKRADRGGSGIPRAPNRLPQVGLKDKDLVGVPWMVAFALRADGWYLRAALPWLKRNPMPESTEDRPNVANEYVFLLSKAGTYYYDHIAVKRRGSSGPSDLRKMQEGRERLGGKHKALDDPLSKASAATNIGRTRAVGSPNRNWRTADAWFDSLAAILEGDEGLVADPDGQPLAFVVNTEPSPEPHFAQWPASLVKPMILAGTSERGCCAQCGAPWERVTGDPVPVEGRGSGNVARKVAREGERSRVNTHLGSSFPWSPTVAPTLGWRAGCGHDPQLVEPCLILDPFVGAGTTVAVAKELGRRAVGIDLSPAYLTLAEKRLRQGVLAL